MRAASAAINAPVPGFSVSFRPILGDTEGGPMSAVLAATLVPTTVAAHSFWQEQDPEVRAKQKVQFLKNLGLLGGLLLAAVDTEVAHHAVADDAQDGRHRRQP